MAAAAAADAAEINERRDMIGVGYRRELADWIDSNPSEVGCLEIIAEHFFDGGEDRLRNLAARFPLCIHGLGLSLGTPGPLDRETLDYFVRVAELADARWVSEHVAFTRTAEVDLGHLNPVRADAETIAVIADHAREVAEACNRPLLLENITTDLRLPGSMPESEFLNRLCEAADCGLLLDVTNLYINAKNHGFDARQWLREIDPGRIVQLHVVGYSVSNGRWRDLHAEQIQDDLWALIDDVLAYAPVQSVILERDQNFPAPAEITGELRRLGGMLARH